MKKVNLTVNLIDFSRLHLMLMHESDRLYSLEDEESKKEANELEALRQRLFSQFNEQY